MELLVPSLMTALFQLPMAITFFVGFVLALIRYNKHPAVSRFALIGFGGLALQSLIATPLITLMTQSMIRNGSAANEIGAATATLSLCATSVGIIWWGCVIAAVFVGRKADNHDTRSNSTNV
jgi:hypothetical protein